MKCKRREKRKEEGERRKKENETEKRGNSKEKQRNGGREQISLGEKEGRRKTTERGRGEKEKEKNLFINRARELKEKEERRAKEAKAKEERRAAKNAEEKRDIERRNTQTEGAPNPTQDLSADVSLANKVQRLAAQFENSILEDRIKTAGKRQMNENSQSQTGEKESKKQNMEEAAGKLQKQVPTYPPPPTKNSSQKRTD